MNFTHTHYSSFIIYHSSFTIVFSHTTTLRVRYADTDQMGVVYYAKYLEYFEVARTDMLRAFGLPYSEIEERGYILPVSTASVKYYVGAKYDDELAITASFTPTSSPKIDITYIISRKSDGAMIADGTTTLVFVDRQTNKPTRAPQFYMDVIARMALARRSNLKYQIVVQTSRF